MGVEWVHQKQRNVASIFGIEILQQLNLSLESPHGRGETKLKISNKNDQKITSIWTTIKSKKVNPSRTSMTDLHFNYIQINTYKYISTYEARIRAWTPDTDTPTKQIIWKNHIIQCNYKCRCRDTTRVRHRDTLSVRAS